MEDVEAALLAAQRVVAQTDIEDDRVLRLRQIGDGEQVVRLEIGNDDGGAVFQDLLGLGGNVAVGRDDVLDEVVFLAEELTALVVILDGEPRPLQTVVGEYGVDERERNRLLILPCRDSGWRS